VRHPTVIVNQIPACDGRGSTLARGTEAGLWRAASVTLTPECKTHVASDLCPRLHLAHNACSREVSITLRTGHRKNKVRGMESVVCWFDSSDVHLPLLAMQYIEDRHTSRDPEMNSNPQECVHSEVSFRRVANHRSVTKLNCQSHSRTYTAGTKNRPPTCSSAELSLAQLRQPLRSSMFSL
jgi:hypothetical protein